MANDAMQDLADLLEPLIREDGIDPAAYHDDVADEIHTTTLKGTPVGADVLVIEDSAAAWVKKRITITSLPAGAPAAHATSHETGGADEISVAGLSGLLADDQNAVAEAGIDTTAVHVDVAAEISAVAAKALPVAADFLLIEDSAAADAKKSITIGTIPVAQAQVANSVVLQPAADAAVALLATTGSVQLVVTAAPTVVISTTSSYPGQKIHLFALAVAGGGSYTLVLDVGTLTLNAASESAVVQRNPGDTAWVCGGLSGATIV